MQVNDPGGGVFPELASIDEVLIGMTAAEEQHRRPERPPLRLERRPLTQEAAKRRQPGARPDHDDGRGRIDG